MSAYDPQARRPTPLAIRLAEEIRRGGPITIERYMQACLQDPAHGYYVHRTAIGAAGDFVTAPEISQVMGELIGLWCAVVWQQMGAPERIELVEIGPGRGTLMADALRAARVLPAFRAAAKVELIETSETLQAVQRATLQGAGVPLSWSARLALGASPVPCIVIANELLDALPVAQHALTGGAWRERMVDIDGDGRLVFALDRARRRPGRDAVAAAAAEGDIDETRDLSSLLLELHRRASLAPLASLLIDYGHVRAATGETLQAVRGHRLEHPLTSPGEADLTAEVDFAALAEQALLLGLAVHGPATQAEFLGSLGVAERASRLMATNPDKAPEIEAGVARLLSPTGMGTRFKAIGLGSAQLPMLPGLPAPAARR